MIPEEEGDVVRETHRVAELLEHSVPVLHVWHLLKPDSQFIERFSCINSYAIDLHIPEFVSQKIEKQILKDISRFPVILHAQNV
ncbi:hypothetical protein ECANGB1_1201 [Enterospora canceri]|uniref:Uncharacterized protein n=1 Tax=Enterospora canceri TaxID=1081671 RepID=A0A1Y1S6J2_9MICR|nr:hypothetical protein ECANGB1_1201 [Enterospora canceri]